jgi:Hemerythrin HHE cation binding domain.
MTASHSAGSQTTKPVTDLLHKDHQKVRDIFFKFDQTLEDKDKQHLLRLLLIELYIHSQVEEEIVYPLVENEDQDSGALIDEAETEHRMIKYLMAELSHMAPSDEQFDAKIKVLSELVNHHIREEENTMFKKLHDSNLNLEYLANCVLERKEELRHLPMPEMSASLIFEDKADLMAKEKNLELAGIDPHTLSEAQSLLEEKIVRSIE